MRKRILILALIGGLMLAAWGCGGQKNAAGSGSAAPEQAKVVFSDANLRVTRVSLSQCTGTLGGWYAIAYLENNTSKVCTGQTLSMTLYDANGNVAGTQGAALGPVYPPGRWVASKDFNNLPTAPVRADVKVAGLTWSDIPINVPRFQTVQASFVPLGSNPTFCKVVGQFSYQGPNNQKVNFKAILLAADGTAIGVADIPLSGNTALSDGGPIPFELQGYMPKGTVAAVEMTYIPQ